MALDLKVGLALDLNIAGFAHGDHVRKVLILLNLKACITAHLLKQGVSTVPTSVTDLNVGDNSVVVTLSFNAKMDLADFECNLKD